MDGGIFVVKQTLARGFDIKLKKNAFVIVVDTDGTLNATTAR